MDKNYIKKNKIKMIWDNMMELITIEEQIVQKMDSFEKSLDILNKKLNN